MEWVSDENEVVYSADQYGQHILHNEVLQPSQLSNDLQPDCWCRVEADLFHLSQGEEQGTVPALDAKELLYQIDQ